LTAQVRWDPQIAEWDQSCPFRSDRDLFTFRCVLLGERLMREYTQCAYKLDTTTETHFVEGHLQVWRNTNFAFGDDQSPWTLVIFPNLEETTAHIRIPLKMHWTTAKVSGMARLRENPSNTLNQVLFFKGYGTDIIESSKPLVYYVGKVEDTVHLSGENICNMH
jgi:hypothetical protein